MEEQTALVEMNTTEEQPANVQTIPQAYTPEDRANYKRQAIELKSQGLSIRKIASTLKLSGSFIHKLLCEDIKAMAKDRGISLVTREDIHKKIFASAPMCLNEIIKLAGNDELKPEVKLKACADLLDRAGFNPINKSVTLSIEELPLPELLKELDAVLDRIEARQAAAINAPTHVPVIAIAATDSPAA
jgi:hypothetical protein